MPVVVLTSVWRQLCCSAGNNVLRTIHGVGEMMTQMVMSRGVPHSLPDTPSSLRYGKGHFLSDNEDVMVMDTKLKIIEILQVRRPLLDE